MTCADVRERFIAEVYLAGGLGPADQDAYEQHYFACSACLVELERLEAAREALASSPKVVPIRPARARAWLWAGAAVAASAAIAAIVWTRAGTQPESPAQARNPVHQNPAAPSEARQQLLALARIEPPAYESLRLRTARPAMVRFEEAMRRYQALDYRAAIAGLEQAVQLDPGLDAARFYLGACYLIEKRDSDGVATLTRLLESANSPFEAEARMLLAKSLIGRGRLAEARGELMRVKVLPGEPASQAARLLALLDSP